jgi:hypothetical protein
MRQCATCTLYNCCCCCCCLQVDKLATGDRSAELQARVLLREKEASELRLENRALAKLQREQDKLIARTEGSALAQVY